MRIVEFDTIMTDLKEADDIRVAYEEAERLSTDPGISFYHEKDYVVKTAINIHKVEGFYSQEVYFNEERVEVVMVDLGDSYTHNLMIDYEDFKEVFQRCTLHQVLNAEEILKE